MIEIKGRYSDALVFTDTIEEEAKSQIKTLCDQSFVQGSKIRIMPDTHAGAGCVIGFTANLGDKFIPNIVGVDIGCGMLTVELGKVDINFRKLDEIIRKYIPCGIEVHQGKVTNFPKLESLKYIREINKTRRIERAIGSLGGGNHFLEIDKNDKGEYFLVIHSGSRNLGKQVAEYYQSLAIDLCSGKEKYFKDRDELILKYKSEGRRKEIQSALKELQKEYLDLMPKYPKDLCFLTGKYREEYLHDMKICQEYATLNRETIANIILDRLFNMKLDDFEFFHTVHNYINFKDNIIRKGSISAYENEKLLIPINMRDGSILCKGKGNEQWNYSAPHGAGRVFSRKKAKEVLSLEEFERSMEGIYTTSINEYTLDEAPMAYKSMDEILKYLDETVKDIEIIKPVYNFKASK